ncbi:MAG: 2-oxoacid:acceptor oxidoreductase family protein [Thermodesulfobacteriota bacterium]
MLRIRFHGRGGQGMKTASRILGTALFLSGYEVQDAPRYGAERRGAPMFAYVRADKKVIFERGIISRPDLVVVADDSLLLLPAAGVSSGLSPHSLLLVYSSHTREELQNRLDCPSPLLTIHPVAVDESGTHPPAGSACAAAAAQLLGLPLDTVCEAMDMELSSLDKELLKSNREAARQTYQQMAATGQRIEEGGEAESSTTIRPHWIELPFEGADLAAPAIHGRATSLHMDTGSWRTLRPLIDLERCSRCGLCHTYCPEGAISNAPDGYPCIDYTHCKGCLICLVQCPMHTIEAVPEQEPSLVEDQ